MKSVKIIGKRNVDSFKPKNERKRKILDKLSEKNILIKENQHKLVKRLCANEDFSGNIFVKKELEKNKKLSCTGHQKKQIK